MMMRTTQIALAAVMLWSGFGVTGRAEAGIALTTPAGLAAGDQFRFVFVTDDLISPSSSSISDYNKFVTSEAQGATYNGSVVSWFAIGSTASTNAINNIGPSNTPVYLVDGTQVTTSTTASGLWSGSLLHPIDEDITGSSKEFLAIYTGTTASGVASADPLGSFFSVTDGDSGETSAKWVDSLALSSFLSERMYGISQVLVAVASVPEPSTLLMAVTALSAGLATAWSRRCSQQRHGGWRGYPMR
jgi:hypothetical protein